MRIRSVLLLFASGIIVPLVLFGVVLIALLVYYQRQAQDQAITDRTRAVATAVDAALHGTAASLSVLASHESLDAGDLKRFREAAGRVLSTQPGWLTIILNSLDGQQLLNLRRSEGAPLPKVADMDAHRAALASQGAVVSGIRVGQVTGLTGISVNIAVRREGKPLYVLLAFIAPKAFQEILEAQKLPPNWFAAVADPKKKFIARIPPVAPGADASTAFGGAFENGAVEGSFRANTVEGIAAYQHYSRSALSGWVVGIAIPASEISGPAWRIAGLVSVAALVTLGLTFGLAAFFSRRITRPITHLASLARRIGTEEASLSAENVSGVQEVAEVSRALRNAASTIKKKEATQRAAEVALRDAKTSAEHAKALAERANRAKDEFLAVLSHELRTPLTPVLAAVELLQRGSGSKENAREPLDIIRRNIQLQARLIDDLLDLTRIAQGKLELKRKAFNICTVIERAVEVAKPDIEARRLHFGVNVIGAPHRVDGDPSRLQQVVWNLLTNAVKFTPEGGCVGLRCERVDNRVVLEVSDSGIGIEPASAGRIFDAFEQGGRWVTRQFGGLGLGLAIAKRLVQMHDGTISVQSEGRNRGSTFRVELPLSSASLQEQEKKTATPANGRSTRILLVEDNGDTAATMKMLLETFGYKVETAGDVKQALEATEAGRFDLLLSDLGLPDGNGVDLMLEIKRRGYAIKGIALSGYGQKDDLSRSREAGFSAHLIKPVDADTLMETIAAVL